MPDKKIILYKFQLILDSLTIIEDRFKPVNNPDDFMTTPDGVMRLDSIAMRLQGIGESLKTISKYDPGFFNKYNDVNWNDIIKFRDFISHHYELINPVVIYDICKTHLLDLKTTIEKIIKDLNK